VNLEISIEDNRTKQRSSGSWWVQQVLEECAAVKGLIATLNGSLYANGGSSRWMENGPALTAVFS
jgi:hypothetical protein